MLKGIDISAWQDYLPDYTGQDFVIFKATEGDFYFNEWLDRHYNHFVSTFKGEKLYGFYHFARPDWSSTPENEAKFFLSKVGHHAGKCLFILDWEAEALQYPSRWAEKWMDYVYNETGVKPIIYTNSSTLENAQNNKNWDFSNLVKKDYGLWIAHWRVDKPDVYQWPFWALWQYTDTPLDSNYFNGNAEQFKLYCKSNKKQDKVYIIDGVAYKKISKIGQILTLKEV